MTDQEPKDIQQTTPESQIFNPAKYIEATRTILDPLTTEHGISFASVRDEYQTELIDLSPEHEAAEELTWKLMRANHPEKSTPQIDSAAQLVAHTSRASAILHRKLGEDFTRFGQLNPEAQTSVIEAVVQSGRGEPNLHVSIGQSPVREIIELDAGSVKAR